VKPAAIRSPRLVAAAIALLLAASASCRGRSDAIQATRHIIYLHGRIVQVTQSTRPHDPEYGYYELDQILDAFRRRGFVVSGAIRPRGDTVERAADRVVTEARALLASGVPADHITVVGASMGAAIALVAAARLQNPRVRYCILGDCLSEGVRSVTASEGHAPSGAFLEIREASDLSTRACPPPPSAWSSPAAPNAPPPAIIAREIVIHTGSGHGFLFRPIPEWLDPVVRWARGEDPAAGA